ncbi:MAG: hypothetical protein KBC21_01870 [Candidatus Pacebacteria bacterium]|nr:hypothetical protein [Candidatus Paceibacterota bacterium]
MEKLSIEQISPQEVKPQVLFQEAKEDDPEYEMALPISVTQDESKEDIEKGILERLSREHWYLQEYWRNKVIQEQIVLEVGEVVLEIFNFQNEQLEDWQLEQIRRVVTDYSQLRNSPVFSLVKSIVIDNEQPINPHSGKELNGWGGSDGAVKLYPAALKPISHRVTGVSNLEGTLIHEFAHSLGVEFENMWRKEFGWEQMEKPEQLMNGTWRLEQNIEPERCITEYARINTAEDICESMVGALRNPGALDPARYRKIHEELLPDKLGDVPNRITKKLQGTFQLPKIKEPFKYKRVLKRRIIFRPL